MVSIKTWYQNRHPIIHTLCETVVVLGVVLGLVWISELVGVNIGNAGMEAAFAVLIKTPIISAVIIVIIAPVIEELVFRSPAYFLRKVSTGWYWGIGALISALFAMAHGMAIIPLPQFISGLFFWYLVRKRGLKHSIIAHASNNAIACAIIAYFLYFSNSGLN